jgi:hypothetical protein
MRAAGTLDKLVCTLSAVRCRCKADCGEATPPTRYSSGSYASQPVSPDQGAITTLIPALLATRPNARLLHVGVGSSQLARDFSARVEWIEGLTVVRDEFELAASFCLPNYRVSILNKYAPALGELPGRFDLIIDNNPGSFACCQRHTHNMMSTYAQKLTPRGLVLTHARGAGWRQRGSWSMGWRSWRAMGRLSGLRAGALGSDVWSLGLAEPPKIR